MAVGHVALILALATFMLLQARYLGVGSGPLGRLLMTPPTPACQCNGGKPVESTLTCGMVNAALTTRELDLQQQRRSVLDCARGEPEGGYLAICLAIKNQHAYLPEWLEWHSRLGVSKFYLMDSGSDPPLDNVLAPYVADGRVEHRMLGDLSSVAEALRDATCTQFNSSRVQLLAYNRCLLDYGTRHQWMAVMDADEFFVLTDGTPDLPTLLRDYEQYGGLSVNWRMFGSNGHQLRQNDTLTAYTACYPVENPVHRYVKTIANMAFATRTQSSHFPLTIPGRPRVTANSTSAAGDYISHVDYSRVVLNHYFTRSAQDFSDKRARGDGMGGARQDWEWNKTQAQATDTCTYAADMAKAAGLAQPVAVA